MATEQIVTLMNGATAMGSAAIALIFLRYWRRSRDRLFAAFAIAFGLFAASRIAASLFAAAEFDVLTYGLRCVAFIVILRCNRPEKS